MADEKSPSEKERIVFQASFFRGYVKLRGCIPNLEILQMPKIENVFFCVWLSYGRCWHEFNSSSVLRLFSKLQGALLKKRVAKKLGLHIFWMKFPSEEQVSIVFLCIVFGWMVDTGQTLKKTANSKKSWRSCPSISTWRSFNYV